MYQGDIDRLIAAAARHYTQRVPFADEDDLKQRGWLAVLESMPAYNLDGVPLNYYLCRIVHRAMRRELSYHSGALARTEHSPPRLTYTDEGDLVTLTFTAEQATDHARLEREVLRVIGDSIARAPSNRLGVDVILEHATPAEVAAERRVPVGDVYQATYRLRNDLAADAVLAHLLAVC